MFDLDRLYAILRDTTRLMLEGDPYPGEDVILDTEVVDVHFLRVLVNLPKAEAHREEFCALLDNWPNDELHQGPSYLQVGGTMDDQGYAFAMFALGKALGLWRIVIPESLGLKDEDARELAGNGGVWMTGYPSAGIVDALEARP